MSDTDAKASQFEQHRRHLRGVAYRMLGTSAEADDAVQEAWLRFHRADTQAVDNLRGWLTTVVARVCLDSLRAQTTRRETAIDAAPAAATAAATTEPPDHDLALAESVGVALLLVLDTLSPLERVAFVLHDTFELPFEDVARIIDKTPAATRQLASRARRRVRGISTTPVETHARQQALVEAFLTASREGDFAALLRLLAPTVVLRADAAAVAMGAAAEVRGAEQVAETFKGRARAAQLATVAGAPGLVWLQGGQPKVAFDFAMRDGQIVAITLRADPASLETVALPPRT